MQDRPSALDIERTPAFPPRCAPAYRAITDAPAGQPFVVAQLGQSLDGRIATRTGESRWINGEAALDHVHRLRSLVDAVVVGVGTVTADDPMLTVRRVPGRHPARVVIDPSGRMPQGLRWLEDNGVRRVVVRQEGRDYPDCGPADVLCVPPRDGRICPRDIVAGLFRIGFRRLLIEGGAWTVSRFIEAGALDRLHVLVAPVIIGSGKSGLDLAPIDVLSDAKRPDTQAYVLDGGDVLFDCDFRGKRGQ